MLIDSIGYGKFTDNIRKVNMTIFKGLEEILEDNLKAIENTCTRNDGDMLIAQTLRIMAEMIKRLNNNLDDGK